MNPLTEQPSKADKNHSGAAGNKDTVRVFFALWPEPSVQQRLHAIAKSCQAQCEARLMRTETLHMTLKFIGNIKHAQLAKLIKAADKITGVTSFNLELNRLAFWKHNRIGYATLKADAPELEKLVAALQQNLADENIASDNTRFCPHVTLFRNVERSLPPQDFTAISWQVTSFALVESVPGNQKTEYRLLREWPLIKAAKSSG